MIGCIQRVTMDANNPLAEVPMSHLDPFGQNPNFEGERKLVGQHSKARAKSSVEWGSVKILTDDLGT